MATRKRSFIGLIAAALIMLGSGVAHAATGVGVVDAVDYERERIVIDGRQYVLAPGVVPRKSDDSGGIVPLRKLQPGTAVRYETAEASQIPRINSLLILTNE